MMKAKRNWRRCLVSWQMIKLALLMALQPTAVCAAGRPTVTWKNEDGTILKVENVISGTKPVYIGETPKKDATEYYYFTFKDWTPSRSAVTEDVTYTATYQAFPKTVGRVYDGMDIGERDADAGLLHVAIMADPHVDSFDGVTGSQVIRYGDAILDAKARGAEKILVVGDINNNGAPRQYDIYHNTVARYASDTEVIEAHGNHELAAKVDGLTPSEVSERMEAWRRRMGTGLYYSQWIGNTHIVALGNDEQYYCEEELGYNMVRGNPSLEQLDWLERIVEEDDRNNVTTIVLFHWLVGSPYTNMGSHMIMYPEREQRLYEVLSSHDNVVYFSGHSHIDRPIYYQVESGPLFMHGGHISSDSIAVQPLYVMMDELPSENGTRKYELKYVRPGVDEPVEIVSFEHDELCKVRVHHFIEGTTQSISDDVVLKLPEAAPYETQSVSRDSKRYTLVSTPENASGVASEAGDVIEVTYYYKVNQYAVEFRDEDGTVLKEATMYDYGTAPGKIVKPADPAKLADAQYMYTFVGWEPKITAVMDNQTYKAKYTAKTLGKYTVTYSWGLDAPRGQNLPIDMAEYDNESLARAAVDKTFTNTTTANGTKSGIAGRWTFSGWDEGRVDSATNTVVFTGRWDFSASVPLETYTVTWKNYDGTVLETDTNVERGTMPSYEGTEPTRVADGEYAYTFIGWEPMAEVVTADTIYTAIFDATLIDYPEPTGDNYGLLPGVAVGASEGTTVYNMGNPGNSAWAARADKTINDAAEFANWAITNRNYTSDQAAYVTLTGDLDLAGATIEITKNTYPLNMGGYTISDAHFVLGNNGLDIIDAGVFVDCTFEGGYGTSNGLVRVRTVGTFTNCYFTGERGNAFIGRDSNSTVTCGNCLFEKNAPAYAMTGGTVTGSIELSHCVIRGTSRGCIFQDNANITGSLTLIKCITVAETLCVNSGISKGGSSTGDADIDLMCVMKDTSANATTVWYFYDGSGVLLDGSDAVDNYGNITATDKPNLALTASGNYGLVPGVVVGAPTGNVVYSGTNPGSNAWLGRADKTINTAEEFANWVITNRENNNQGNGYTLSADIDLQGATVIVGANSRVLNLDGHKISNAKIVAAANYALDLNNGTLENCTFDRCALYVREDATLINCFFKNIYGAIINRNAGASIAATNCIFTSTDTVNLTNGGKVNGVLSLTHCVLRGAAGAHMIQTGATVTGGMVLDKSILASGIPNGSALTGNDSLSGGGSVVADLMLVMGATAVGVTEVTYYGSDATMLIEAPYTVVNNYGEIEVTCLTVNGTTIEADSNFAINKDGSINIPADGMVTAGYSMITASSSGRVIVNPDGSVSVAAGEIIDMGGVMNVPAGNGTLVTKYGLVSFDNGTANQVDMSITGSVISYKGGIPGDSWYVVGMEYSEITDEMKSASLESLESWSPEASTFFNIVSNRGTELELPEGVTATILIPFAAGATQPDEYVLGLWRGSTYKVLDFTPAEDTEGTVEFNTPLFGPFVFGVEYRGNPIEPTDSEMYTVTWRNVDGSVLKTDTVAYGTTPSYSGETPTKAEDAQYTYTFAGWTPEITPVTGDATYTATYNETVNKYTVKFVNEDGTELQSSEVEYGATPSYSGETPTKAADAQYTYTFAGWTPEIAPVTGDTTYTATYTATPIEQPAPETYTVTWKNYDGTVLKTDKNVASGTKPEYRGTTPTKASDGQYTYAFAGWATEPNQEYGTAADGLPVVSGNVTYYAAYGKRKQDTGGTSGRAISPATVLAAPSSSGSTGNLGNSFTDLLPGAWYSESVDYVIQNGIMNGYPNGEFGPDENCSRSMFVTMLHRLAGEPAAANRADYLDVRDDDWYSGAVAWATANNVVNGVGGNCFDPDGSITREQLVAILYRYAKSRGYDVTVTASLNGFTDAKDVSAYALDAMRWAYGSKLITGMTPAMLEPQGMATRAQVAAMLMRFCENVAK